MFYACLFRSVLLVTRSPTGFQASGNEYLDLLFKPFYAYTHLSTQVSMISGWINTYRHLKHKPDRPAGQAKTPAPLHNPKLGKKTSRSEKALLP